MDSKITLSFDEEVINKADLSPWQLSFNSLKIF